MIRIEKLCKAFGQQIVLNGVNLTIEDGGVTAIVGPSGTGKSVLLKIITGLVEADAGNVFIDQDEITAARRSSEKLKICSRMGVLFQNAALIDSLNLFENVAFALRYRTRIAEKEIIKRCSKYISEVGLQGYELALPGEVSIGIRKRVGIARALVTEPEFLLFDEPNTGLDPAMGQEIYELIIETQKLFGFTGIVISHEIPEVFQVCNRVAMLYEGRVQIDGSVEEFMSSEIPVVKQFRKGDIVGPITLV